MRAITAVTTFEYSVYQNEKGKTIGETCEESLKKIIDLATETGATDTPADFSIATRLSGQNGKCRHIVVRFAKRTARLDSLRRKKILKNRQYEEHRCL